MDEVEKIEKEYQAMLDNELESDIADLELPEDVAIKYRRLDKYIRHITNLMDEELENTLEYLPDDIHERYCTEIIRLLRLKDNTAGQMRAIIERYGNE